MKNNIPSYEKFIMKTFKLNQEDIYKARQFDSKELTNQETWEVKQSWAMKSIMINWLVKNHSISFKMYEHKDEAQIVKYNRETKVQNFITFSKETPEAIMLQLQAYLAQRTTKSTYTVDNFVA